MCSGPSASGSPPTAWHDRSRTIELPPTPGDTPQGAFEAARDPAGNGEMPLSALVAQRTAAARESMEKARNKSAVANDLCVFLDGLSERLLGLEAERDALLQENAELHAFIMRGGRRFDAQLNPRDGELVLFQQSGPKGYSGTLIRKPAGGSQGTKTLDRSIVDEISCALVTPNMGTDAEVASKPSTLENVPRESSYDDLKAQLETERTARMAAEKQLAIEGHRNAVLVPVMGDLERHNVDLSRWLAVESEKRAGLAEELRVLKQGKIYDNGRPTICDVAELRAAKDGQAQSQAALDAAHSRLREFEYFMSQASSENLGLKKQMMDLSNRMMMEQARTNDLEGQLRWTQEHLKCERARHHPPHMGGVPCW